MAYSSNHSTRDSNEPTGPRKDSSGRNASSASRPSSSGYNSAKSGGNLSKNSTGLRTGSTIYGNTAFGPAGGMAVGYGTMKNGTLSNFKDLRGNPVSTSGSKSYSKTAPAEKKNPLGKLDPAKVPARVYQKLQQVSPRVAEAIKNGKTVTRGMVTGPDGQTYNTSIVGVRGGNPFGVQAYNGGPAVNVRKDQSRVPGGSWSSEIK